MGFVCFPRRRATGRRCARTGDSSRAGGPGGACRAEGLERRTLLAFGPLGQEFHVNTAAAGDQWTPAVAADADGDFVVVWNSRPTSSTLDHDVMARRYSASGAALGPEFIVNSTVAGNQGAPAVAMDADGDFVVVWQSGPGSANPNSNLYDVYARRYSAAGVPLGDEFRVNSVTDGNDLFPSVAMDADGDFAVGWHVKDATGRYDVYLRRYNPAGLTGPEYHVAQAPGNSLNASVAMGAQGKGVVAWQHVPASGVPEIHFGVFGPSTGGDNVVHTNALFRRTYPSVEMDADGDFVIAWTSYGQGGANSGIYAQRYNGANFQRLGSEFQVNTGVPNGLSPAVGVGPAGEFLVAWNTGPAAGVRARLYDAAGVAQGGELQVAATALSFTAPAVAVGEDGDFVVAWDGLDPGGNGIGVFARRYEETVDATGPMVTDVSVGGRRLEPNTEFRRPVSQVVLNFSERLSTLGGPAGPGSATNPANWRLTVDGEDASSWIQSVAFGYNASTRKYEAAVNLTPLRVSAPYVLIAPAALRDVAGNPLDGNFDGTPGGDYAIPFTVANDPPVTSGIPAVTVTEDEDDTVVSLFDAFEDEFDSDAALTFAVTGNSNPGLFSAVRLDGSAGTLTLDYAPDQSGAALITVSATDADGKSTSTSFPVTVHAVNDPPVNTVPLTQVLSPGAALEFRADNGNAITVADVDAATVTLTLETDPANTFELTPALRDLVTSSAPGVVVASGRVGDINKGLEGLRLVPPARFAGSTFLRVTTNDNGATGAGGPGLDVDVIPIVYASDPVVLSVGDARAAEGDFGVTALTFPVRLQGRPRGAVVVSYATADGAATVAGGDYQAAQGVLTFEPGETEKLITVQVNGDVDVEPDETFFVNLIEPTRGVILVDGQGIGTISNDDAPRPTPVVTQVFVSGSAWTPGYRSFLAAQGLGDATYGYAVPAGAAQLGVLPWGNLNRVSVRFNTDVLVLDVDLLVRGVRSSAYGFSGFDYDDATHTATWTLAQPVTNDKLLLDLNGGPDGIVNLQAVKLDGEWANGADTFPSGDGTPGGNLRFRLNVLGGDVTRNGRVDYSDWLDVRRRSLRTAANPGSGPTGYTAFHDPSGDGIIGTMDLLMVRRNLLRGLPPTEPAGAGFAPQSLATSITRELFSTAPVVS